MPVDPIKPTLKPTGNKRLKLQCDILLSTSAFRFNLRRYNEADEKEQAIIARLATHDASIQSIHDDCNAR